MLSIRNVGGLILREPKAHDHRGGITTQPHG
jgi:hypothetical protein